jgi:hypothetical protein
MRLQFNARTYIPAPDYRDDHRWMWPTDVLHGLPPQSAVAANDERGVDTPAPDIGENFGLYPDRLRKRTISQWWPFSFCC